MLLLRYPTLGLLLATSVGLGGGFLLEGLGPQAGLAIQRLDGTVAFETPPQLLAATTTRSQVQSPRSTFYFTLQVPETAGEPLATVVIAPDNLVRQLWPYDLEATQVFTGTRQSRGENLSIGSIQQDETTRAVTLEFDPPVPPGTTLTIGLRPERNPRASGTYLFGVTAFPPGEQPAGQFIGFGRLSFYSNDSDPWNP